MSLILSKAAKYIKSNFRGSSDLYRPEFHFSAPLGWLNDPNGLIFFQKQFHLFYQYNPYATKWGNMHWGHAVSRDLLHWQNLMPALAPDEDYDRSGAFSGSAIERGGLLYLMYTGHVVLADGSVTETQNIAYSLDGLNFKKYEKNPVIAADKLPEGASRSDFRDPKIIHHDGHYYAVIASTAHAQGQILLYRSDDLLDWQYFSTIFSNRPELGMMAECPDLFQLDDQYALVFSAIVGPDLPNAVYLALGDLDWSTGHFQLNKISILDQGQDFYAPQSFSYQGQRIMIPWLRNNDLVNYLSDGKHSWNGQMGIPRELSLANGALIQRPVLELGQNESNSPFSLSSKHSIAFLDTLILNSNSGLAVGDRLLLTGGQEKIELSRQTNSDYELNLTLVSSKRRINIMSTSDKDQVLILLLDRSSLELFIDNTGVASVVLYPERPWEKISYFGTSKFTGRIINLENLK